MSKSPITQPISFSSTSTSNYQNNHQHQQQKEPQIIDLTKDQSNQNQTKPSTSSSSSSSSSTTTGTGRATGLASSFKARHGPRQQQLAALQATARRQAEQRSQQPQPPQLHISSHNHHHHPQPHHQPKQPFSSSNSYSTPSTSSLSIPQSQLHQFQRPSSYSLTPSPRSNTFSLPTSNHPNHHPTNPQSNQLHNSAHKPVCIGLLSSLVLILYPIKQFQTDSFGPAGKPRAQTLPVRLRRLPPNGGNETLKVLSPSDEEFGMVEHKVGNVIAPLLGPIDSISGGPSVGGWKATESDDDDEIVETDGLGGNKLKRRLPPLGRQLYIECCVIRRGEKNPLMLPLQLLVFCLPESISAIGAYLTRSNVILEHPLSYDPELHLGCPYHNPHSAQPREGLDQIRQRLLGGPAYGTSNLFLGTRSPQFKTYDALEQVDAVFKSLASGVDLDETQPSDLISSKLYAHQKQALSFMLDRETPKEVAPELSKVIHDPAERKALLADDEANLVCLWKKSRDPYGRHVGWVNVVTGIEQIGIQTPNQCRGSLLADDMGLGKTISIISLIATTLVQARNFGQNQTSSSSQPPQENSSSSSTARTTIKDSNASTANEDDHMMIIEGSSSNPKKRQKETKSSIKKKEATIDRNRLIKMKSRATLIICPLSTVQNWESQIEEHVRKGSTSTSKDQPDTGLSVCVYHGNSRTTDTKVLADHDVVITTYSLLGYEYSRQNRKEEDGIGQDSSDGGIEELDGSGNPLTMNDSNENSKRKRPQKRKRKGDGLPSPLQSIEWFRVVLDEAHMIKEHSTIQSRAACDLLAERRVCLTGTPLQNSLNDLFSLVAFLRLEPFTDRVFWTTHIGTPAKLGDKLGVSRLKLIMRQIALRRTKNSIDKNGKPILSLPPKRDTIVYLELDEIEKKFYSTYHQRSRKNFESQQKDQTVLKNYCSILQELLRLRQICAHMGLVTDSDGNSLGSNHGNHQFIKSLERQDRLMKEIEKEGLTKFNSVQLLNLMRETGVGQCSECGEELMIGNPSEELDEIPSSSIRSNKRSNKKKVKSHLEEGVESICSTPSNHHSKSIIVTRCQHLFCVRCFREEVSPDWPLLKGLAECTVCFQVLQDPKKDIMEISDLKIEEVMKKEEEEVKEERKEKKEKEKEKEKNEYGHSTKVRHLICDLLPFSQANPASMNYDPNHPIFELQDQHQTENDEDPESDYKATKGSVVKSVVFSQWTKLLDKIGNALDEFKIGYGRLDGTMNRPERNKAMEDLKTDPKCEVLLVSLRAGGVGLNLTCAQRVYLMEPFWNPAVENQAVDRVHRLGQTKPVRMIRYIISGSVEQNMLEIQKRKTELANMSLGQTLSKVELAKRRVEDLSILFKDNISNYPKDGSDLVKVEE
ncbi:SNF2 family N-terminal domain-containing protein [Melampsora americana]|nr:SNF2 family N-terminal domain-containing protein [Melampsora americana]